MVKHFFNHFVGNKCNVPSQKNLAVNHQEPRPKALLGRQRMIVSVQVISPLLLSTSRCRYHNLSFYSTMYFINRKCNDAGGRKVNHTYDRSTPPRSQYVYVYVLYYLGTIPGTSTRYQYQYCWYEDLAYCTYCILIYCITCTYTCKVKSHFTYYSMYLVWYQVPYHYYQVLLTMYHRSSLLGLSSIII